MVQASDIQNGGNFEKLLEEAKTRYGYIDSIFSTDDELRNFLIEAVNSNYSKDLFFSMLTNTKWFIKNAESIQARGFSRRQYESLIKEIDKADPDYDKKVKAAAGDTTYWRGLDSTKAYLEGELTERGINYTPQELSLWASELYDTANEKNISYINRYLNFKVGFSTSKKGKGATNLANITSYAQDQGLDIDKDFSESDKGTWLQRMDRGESLDAIKKEIELRAMIGESEAVQGLMKQGLTRKTIYTTTVNRFNQKLDRGDATMNHPWIQKNAKDDKGNLLPGYALDLKIMADPNLDWDKTNEGREEYSNYALRILKDFGLTGGR